MIKKSVFESYYVNIFGGILRRDLIVIGLIRGIKKEKIQNVEQYVKNNVLYNFQKNGPKSLSFYA